METPAGILYHGDYLGGKLTITHSPEPEDSNLIWLLVHPDSEMDGVVLVDPTVGITAEFIASVVSNITECYMIEVGNELKEAIKHGYGIH